MEPSTKRQRVSEDDDEVNNKQLVNNQMTIDNNNNSNSSLLVGGVNLEKLPEKISQDKINDILNAADEVKIN